MSTCDKISVKSLNFALQLQLKFFFFSDKLHAHLSLVEIFQCQNVNRKQYSRRIEPDCRSDVHDKLRRILTYNNRKGSSAMTITLCKKERRKFLTLLVKIHCAKFAIINVMRTTISIYNNIVFVNV